MDISISREKCCGCRTCVLECPTKAINFSADEYGFEYPIVDQNKCIQCGLCSRVCPALNPPQRDAHLRCGAALAKDAAVLKNCSSGGLFGLFAGEIINSGGVVYGAALDQNLQLKTTAAKSISELSPLYKSKYFLCDTDGQFANIKDNLEKGGRVLYCSSPCQIQALNLYLKKEYPNLITADFVCHGVGSQALFDKSIQYLENKKKIKIIKYSFRSKDANDSSNYYCEYHYMKDQKENTSRTLYLYDPYYNAYQKRLACRDSCYDCHFASDKRASDITIADFHTIDQYYPSVDRFAGVSMFVCNTEKGLDFFNQFSERLEVYDMPWSEVVRNNRFHNTEKPPKNRDMFLETLRNESFDVLVQKYLKALLSWKQIIYYHSPKFVRNIALKIIKR